MINHTQGIIKCSLYSNLFRKCYYRLREIMRPDNSFLKRQILCGNHQMSPYRKNFALKNRISNYNLTMEYYFTILEHFFK